MAIYHYHREIGKRPEGKNAVFAVAYIRGEQRTCHKTQETKDFTYKHDVIYSDCLLPEDAPAWALKLRNSHIQDKTGQYTYDKTGFNFSDNAWNQLEIVEKRADSQLYFHDDFAIPVELDKDSAISLVRDFVKDTLAVKGVFCDVAIHWDLMNPHAHVVMPLRQLTEEGFSKKQRFGKGELSQLVTSIREQWATCANRKMMEQGIDARIDHRSHKVRGLELIPTVKVGKAAYMHGTKQQDIRIAQNQLVRAQNFEKITENPDVLVTKVAQERHEFTQTQVEDELAKYVVGEAVLSCIKAQEDASRESLVNGIIDTLKQEKSVFSERELKQWVLEKTGDTEEFSELVKRITSSDALINLGLGDDGRIHYVTREAFQLENELGLMTERLAAKSTFLVSDVVVAQVAKDYGLNDIQRVALQHLTQEGNLGLVVGVAGSGKTYMLKAAREVWEQSGYRVRGVAYSGRAAAGLESESGIASMTIARFLKNVGEGRLQVGPTDIVVMDEMGMTALDEQYQLMRVVSAAGGKFAGVGDTEQTQPIGRGAPMRAMIEQVGVVAMDTVLRQKVDWQAQATLAMERQRTAEGLDAYSERGHVHFADTPQASGPLLIEHWHRQLTQQDDATLSQQIIIAHKNETVNALNHLARERLVADNRLEKSKIIVRTPHGELAVSEGERLLFGAKNYRQNIKNGEFGTVTQIQGHRFTVTLDNQRDITLSATELQDFKYGYAATVHKLQGYTGDYAFEYIDSRGWDRHLFLVGSSRHRHNLTIVADHETFEDYDDLKEVVSRHGLKDHVFDYPVSFSLRRGFERDRVVGRALGLLRKTGDKAHDGWLWLTNYQAYLEKQVKRTQDPFQDLKQRRRDAVIVADFCDKRIEIAKAVEAIHAMPGYELKLVFDEVPTDLHIEEKQLLLYKEETQLMVAAMDAEGNLVRLPIDKAAMDATLWDSIDNRLCDPYYTGTRLNHHEQAAIFDVTSPYGFEQRDQKEKVARLQAIYQQQLKNSVLARQIKARYESFKLAIERNRLTYGAIEKSVAFGERHDEIKALAEQYHLNQFYDPAVADNIVSQLSSYYGHITSSFGETQDKHRFIHELKHQAHQWRYDRAFEHFGVAQRETIKSVKYYLDLDYEVGLLLLEKEGRKIHAERLNSLSIKRNELANQLLAARPQHQAILEHFGVEQARLRTHQLHHLARASVKHFSELLSSELHSPNLLKQVLAHRMVSHPKRYGPYVHEFLKEGWKTINLENYHYTRKRTLSTASAEFKESHRLVRRYFDVAYAARDAWAKAIRCRQSASPNKERFIQRAQSFSDKRDRLASRLIKELERHAGALTFNKTDLSRLSARAGHYDYYQRYLKEANRTRKIHMAHTIAQNMKSFGHAVSLTGRYQEIKEHAHHYNYLRLVKRAPDQPTRDIIRLAERYQQKRVAAGRAWGAVKVNQRLGKETRLLASTAKHALQQRNLAAYHFEQAAAKQDRAELQIIGVTIDYEALSRAAMQHVAYLDVLHYLNASSKEKGHYANELLNNRASYHFVFEHNIDFNVLRQEANAWIASHTYEAQAATKTTQTQHWDVELIRNALISSPEETYRAILGEPKKRTSKAWRYSGGLIVTLKGNDAGKWYSFTEGVGGGPIKAIQEKLGLSFKEALAYGASLAGLSESQAKTVALPHRSHEQAVTPVCNDKHARQRSIESANSIWTGTTAIQGTLSERYFNEHRHVADVGHMEIRHWPIGAEWMTTDEQGQHKQQVNKVPAAVIAVRNEEGDLTGVQRIYLDKNTAGKAHFMDNPKLSKGVIRGAAGVIQRGQVGGRLYIAEGPETGATLAMAEPNATVLVSMGINNLPNLAPVIASFAPSEMILAADNDGVASTTRAMTEKAFDALQSSLSQAATSCRLVYPAPMAGFDKVDWNDVLIEKGLQSIKAQLHPDKHRSFNDFYYSDAAPIAYTPAEHYLREVKGLIGVDLSEVRYHAGIQSPHSTQREPAFILPVYNQAEQQLAEVIYTLDKAGEAVVHSRIVGEPTGGVAIINRGDDVSTLYIADNLLDAKSLAVGNPRATILLSLNHYQDLVELSWVLESLPKKPGAIALVTDSFDKATEKRLFAVSQPLREKGYHVVMVKGKLKGDYSHISINEALHHQEKIRPTSLIQRKAIGQPVREKTSLKDKLVRAIKPAQQADDMPVTLKRPVTEKQHQYYIELTKTQRKHVNDYFKAVEQLSAGNCYRDALHVAKTATAVFDALKDEVRQINFHPQSVKHVRSASDSELIRERVLHKQSLGLRDAWAMLQDISRPKLDTKTQAQFNELTQMMAKKDYGKDFDKRAKQFMHEKAALINAWRDNKLMPGSGLSRSGLDADAAFAGGVERDTFLRVTKLLDESLQSHGQQHSHKQSRAEDDDDRSRGGRAR